VKRLCPVFVASAFAASALSALAPSVSAQSPAFEKCATEKTLEACEKLVELPVFCSKADNVKLYLGLDPENGGSILLNLESPQSSPLNTSGFFYAANGRLRDGAVKEVKISKAVCTQVDGMYECKGALPQDVQSRLAEKFNFGQEVLTILLRDSKLRDVCVGKLANDERTLTDNGRLERQFCEFTPAADYSSASGSGFFDPKGYGTSGDSLLHVAFEGLPTGKATKGCTQLGNSYQEVFSITSYDVDKGDAEIYGTLSADEQALLTEQGLEYSYDLYRQLAGNSGTISSLSRSLSLLNRQISNTAATTEVRDSNKKFDELKRKQKKEKEGTIKKKTRSLAFPRLLTMAAADTAPTEKPTEVFQWLAFDPKGGGDLILAPSCSTKSITRNSYGILSCNAPNSSTRACYALASTDPSALAKGNACFEQRNGYALATIRVEGAADGTYFICNNGSLVTSEQLNVTTDSLGSFGELQITDNSLAAQNVPGLVLGTVSAVGTITIGTAQDCSSPTLQGLAG
jgi:hypothetical protein